MRKFVKAFLRAFIGFDNKRFDFTGQSVVLLCNGPSLNDVDFDKVDGPIVGLNKIYLKKEVIAKLCFVVAVNKLVVRQMFKSHEARRLHRAIPVFIPSHRLLAKLFLRKSIFLNIDNSNHFSNKGSTFGVGSTVTYVALQLIYRFNASKVYVVGMDHSFNQVGANNEKQTLNGMDSNHFDSRYFANMSWQLADLPNSERSYAKARVEFEEAGKKILLVGSSKYNGWERVSLEDFYRVVNG